MIEVSRTAVELFGLRIHWYAVLIVAGIALGVLLAAVREERLGLPVETTLDLALACVPAAIVGARIYYVVFEWKTYAAGSWWKVLAVWEGGMAIYGGIIAGVLAGWIYARAKKLPFWKLADLAAPCIPLGQAIGRWGNFMNQEAHGAMVTNPALRFFPAAVNIGGEWFYATFFYESAWCLLIAAVLLVMEKRRCFLRRSDAFLSYVFLYALERAVVEGMRTDSLYLGPVRVSQLLSLLAALTVTLVWALRMKRVPRALRWTAPVCVLAALAAAAAGSGMGAFAAVVAALATTSMMYTTEIRKTENRGEER